MEWFLWLMVLPVLGVAALVGAGRFGGMPPVVHDAPVLHLPAGTLTGSDLHRVQFEVVPRGYSRAQVDDLLGRLARQLDAGECPAPGRVPQAAGFAGESAIMGAHEYSQPIREGEDGSNEAADR